MSTIRLLTAADIPAAMRLKDAAGWNQTAGDWALLLRLAPQGCFGMECGGVLAATTTAVCFGNVLAWIGMVLTHPDFRRRGLARALMEHALAYLEACGVACIKLDATDQGAPLYRQLGFVDEQPIERWCREPGPVVASEVAPFRLPDWLPLDRDACGVDRGKLLEQLAVWDAAALPGGGYAMGRPGSRADYFGPCVCRTADAARRLLGWRLAAVPGRPVYWDLLPANRDAAALARDCGFQPLRRLVRMARPGRAALAPASARPEIFAIAGFEFG